MSTPKIVFLYNAFVRIGQALINQSIFFKNMAALFPFLGKTWSLWSAAGEQGDLNIVSGHRVIASEILSVLLVQKGEHPALPDYGLAPELLQPLSTFEAQYWVYTARQEILRWVAGIAELAIEINEQPDADNALSAYITYTPRNSPDRNLLTFGWYAYTGAIYNQEFSQFLDNVQLNGERFAGLV